MYLDVQNLTKRYGSFAALDNVSVHVDEGEFVCLLGPSGCGKTTLLRVIAGLTDFDAGDVLLQGENLLGVPARERGFGIVFQSYSLFPNMTVAENIGYGLTIRNVPGARIAARVAELLEMIHLGHLADRLPWQLSGGQQQRVALARAIAVGPRMLLLDEPLSALDARVRAELRGEIRRLQKSLRIPTLMVTHDQEEAMALADQIICMNRGRVVQAGAPVALYHRPATRFVAEFMGISNLLNAAQLRAVLPALLAARPPDGDPGALACIRPERIGLVATPDGNAQVREITFLGNLSRIELTTPAGPITAETHGPAPCAEGDRVRLVVRPEDCAWVAGDAGSASDAAAGDGEG